TATAALTPDGAQALYTAFSTARHLSATASDGLAAFVETLDEFHSMYICPASCSKAKPKPVVVPPVYTTPPVTPLPPVVIASAAPVATVNPVAVITAPNVVGAATSPVRPSTVLKYRSASGTAVLHPPATAGHFQVVGAPAAVSELTTSGAVNNFV